MKASFDRIKEQLEDPLFEARYLGKETIRQRTFKPDKYGTATGNVMFIDWTPEDDNGVTEYSFRDTMIGRLLIANTSKGVCFLGFADNGDAAAAEDFRKRFPARRLSESNSHFQQLAVSYCNGDRTVPLPLHIKGTGFQTGIWKQLARIPEGRLSTYGSLGTRRGEAQAVGQAVGANPVSYIVPCHRVVNGDGGLGGYHWGTEVKKRLLAYELQND